MLVSPAPRPGLGAWLSRSHNGCEALTALGQVKRQTYRRWANQLQRAPNGSDGRRARRPTTAAFLATVAPSLPAVLSTAHFEAGISVVVGKGMRGTYWVKITTDRPRPGLKLHWAFNDWEAPPHAALPPHTVPAGADGPGAVQTPFHTGESVTIIFPEAICPSTLVFVVKEWDWWITDHGADFTVQLKPTQAPPQPQPAAARQPQSIAIPDSLPASLAALVRPQPPPREMHFEEAGISVNVSRERGAYTLEVTSHHPRPGLLLHWGVNDWELLPVAQLPPGTCQAGEGALQSPFRDGKSVSITFPEGTCPGKVMFVLKEGDRWINNRGHDFAAHLKPRTLTAGPFATPSTPRILSMARYEAAGVSVQCGKGFGMYRVTITADQPRPGLLLHWAVDDWDLPAAELLLPPGSVQCGSAMQTPFQEGRSVTFTFPKALCPSKLVFVIKDGLAWLNNDGSDFMVQLKPQAAADGSSNNIIPAGHVHTAHLPESAACGQSSTKAEVRAYVPVH